MRRLEIDPHINHICVKEMVLASTDLEAENIMKAIELEQRFEKKLKAYMGTEYKIRALLKLENA